MSRDDASRAPGPVRGAAGLIGFTLDVRRGPPATVMIELEGTLGPSAAHALVDAVHSISPRTGLCVAVDLRNATEFTAAGVRALFELDERSYADGFALVLVIGEGEAADRLRGRDPEGRLPFAAEAPW